MGMFFEILRRAIAQNSSVTVICDNHVRFVSPHALGMTRGNVAGLVAFEYGGASNGLPPEGRWVCLELPRLKNVRENNDLWAAGSYEGKPLSWLLSIDQHATASSSGSHRPVPAENSVDTAVY